MIQEYRRYINKLMTIRYITNELLLDHPELFTTERITQDAFSDAKERYPNHKMDMLTIEEITELMSPSDMVTIRTVVGVLPLD